MHSAYAPPLAPQVHDSGSMTALIWRGNVVRHEPGAWGQCSFLFVAPGRLKPAHFVERRHRVLKDICQQSWQRYLPAELGRGSRDPRLACNNGVRNLRTFTTKVVRSGPTGTKESSRALPFERRERNARATTAERLQATLGAYRRRYASRNLSGQKGVQAHSAYVALRWEPRCRLPDCRYRPDKRMLFPTSKITGCKTGERHE